MTFIEFRDMFLAVKAKLEVSGLPLAIVTVWVCRTDYQTIIAGLKGQFLIKGDLELCKWFGLKVGVTDNDLESIITFGILIKKGNPGETGTLESVITKDFLTKRDCDVDS